MKLRVSVIPLAMQGQNLRSAYPSLWPHIAKAVKRRDSYMCVCCGSYDDLEAHEDWRFDWLTGRQWLGQVVTVCEPCHRAIHLPLTRQYEGRVIYQMTLHHMAIVNRWGWWRTFFHVQQAGLAGWLRNKRGAWHLETGINRLLDELEIDASRGLASIGTQSVEAPAL